MNSRKKKSFHYHFDSCNLINDTLFITYPVNAQPFNNPPTRRLLAKDPPLFRILFLSLLKNKMKVYKRIIVHPILGVSLNTNVVVYFLIPSIKINFHFINNKKKHFYQIFIGKVYNST